MNNYSLFIIHYLLGMLFHIIGGDILHMIFKRFWLRVLVLDNGR